jgi:hypothetical protein
MAGYPKGKKNIQSKTTTQLTNSRCKKAPENQVSTEPLHLIESYPKSQLDPPSCPPLIIVVELNFEVSDDQTQTPS